ncbi:MAG: S8 family serine peptidase [Candidatus Limnocylindria bacterium]
MSRAISSLLAVLLLLATALPAAADEPALPGSPVVDDAKGTSGTSVEVAPDRVLVGWRNPQRAGEVAAARGLTVQSEPASARPELSVVGTGGRAVNDVIAELKTDPNVAFAEPDYLLTIADEPAAVDVTAVSVNDPKTADQYALNRMRVRDAWEVTAGGNRVVAVLDTGVWAGHPDLAGRIVAGHDFANDDSNPADDNGHGTWVSGVIAANSNNGVGIAGVSWTDRVMPVKVMNANGSGYTSDVAFGINWAVDQGATVINMSIGGVGMTSSFLSNAIDYAWDNGVVLVGAAGNDRTDTAFYPASYPKVVSVSATQVDDEFSNWSNYGADVDVSAPGASVLMTNCAPCKPGYTDTTGDNRYTYVSGTSFAAPNVAGVVALIWDKYPSYTNAQVVARLKSTADDLGMPGWDKRYGHGRVNALRAVGVSSPTIPLVGRDSFEANDWTGAAKPIALGSTVRPTIYPAGDLDFFAVDVPRAGRLSLSVTAITDDRAWPWNKSALPIDPVVILYRSDGSRIVTIDNSSSSAATEHGSVQMDAPGRILIRVHNWMPNGSRKTYAVSTSFTDNVAPRVIGGAPAAGSTNVSRFPAASVRFDEPVVNVSGATVRIRDTVTNGIVPASVTYSSARREATIRVEVKLAAERLYRIEATSGIKDPSGLALKSTSWTFRTGVSGFSDTIGSPFDYDIAWLAEEGITAGCGGDRFCPKAGVTREQMASFLVRGLDLPYTGHDAFGDDNASQHEGDINRLAASGITGGCGPARFCPKVVVTREQMASFLARALKLPAAGTDHFSDDESSAHEADINRLAAAGITGGCSATSFCPRAVVNREQMAAFLHRALGD